MLMKKSNLIKTILLSVGSISAVAGGIYAFITDMHENIRESGLIEQAESQAEEKVQNAQQIITSFEEVGRIAKKEFENEYAVYIESSSAETSAERDIVTVVKVVDGDTLRVIYDGIEKEVKVRLIGINTPESVAPETYRTENTAEGKKVSDLVKEKVQEGDKLYLEYDVSETDKYGRILAYVYFPDGTMMQDWLLENGYAEIYTLKPDTKYAEHFAELEQQAKEQNIGIWNEEFITE